jgi:hypothetical protein
MTYVLDGTSVLGSNQANIEKARTDMSWERQTHLG